MLKLELKGMAEVRATLKKIAEEAPEKCRKALRRRGELIMSDSKKNYVPVDTGALKNTGHVITSPAPKIQVILSYGGPATPYAIVQHERTNYHHKVGQAKYLERPVMAAVATLAQDLAKDIKL